ncbi:MAG: branched-chain amino acid ABC transporter permease [Thermoleophilia bacterium]|nr:branched-chain amino acid ABC transporter permease [Thermoleophilia bacterium]
MVWVNDIIQGILLGGLYALFAAGLSLVFGVMRLVNLAHGDFSIMAAYIALVIVGSLKINPFYTLILVMIVMAVFGYVIQRGLFNFAMDAGPMQAILATFGIAIIIQNLLLEGFTANSKGLDAGRIENATINISDQVIIGWFPLTTLLVSVVVLLFLQFYLSRTRMGRAFRATADNQRAAQLMGIDNRHLYGMAMAFALAIVAIGGVFIGIRTTFTPSAGPLRLIFAYEAVIIGGLGSIWGTLVGGVVLGIAQVLGDHAHQGWGMLAGHLVFLALLAFRPQGLFAKQVQ